MSQEKALEDDASKFFNFFRGWWLDIRAVREVLLWLLSIAAAAALLTYAVLAFADDDGWWSPSAFWAVTVGTSAALIASVLAVAVNHLLQARYVRTVTEYQTLMQCDITGFIESAKRTIHISVHGWDGLFCGEDGKEGGLLRDDWKTTARAQAWARFFSQPGLGNGLLTLTLPHVPTGTPPSPDDLVPDEWVHLKTIAERTNKSLVDQVEEIQSTIRMAEELGGNSVHVTSKKEMSWTCVMAFDDTLLISLYATQRGRGVFEAPVFSMTSGKYRFTDAWLRRELR